MYASLLKMKVDMELRGFSPKTVSAYTKSVQTIALSFKLDPEQLNTEHIRSFLHNAIAVRHLSRSYVNNAYSAARFYLETTRNLYWDIKHIPRVKKSSKLPITLSTKQVQQMFDSITNIRHLAMLMCCYSSGLRVSEVLNLKISDINSDSMYIRIRDGKGNKERFTLLSSRHLAVLRQYYRIYKPTEWLFFNSKTKGQLSTRSLQLVMKEYVDKANLPVGTTLHTLRHSFATHLVLKGVSIAVIQKLLGHSNISTTAQYLHLSNVETLSVTSPLDNLEF